MHREIKKIPCGMTNRHSAFPVFRGDFRFRRAAGRPNRQRGPGPFFRGMERAMSEETARDSKCPGDDRLSAWFDGEEVLDAAQLEHLETCPECQAYLTACKQLKDAVERRESAASAQRILAAVHEKTTAFDRRKTRLAWTLRLIVFALLTAFFIYLMLTHR